MIDTDPAEEFQADATREFIGVYVYAGNGRARLRFSGAEENQFIELYNTLIYYEMRRATHGPIVTEKFTITTPDSADGVVMIVNREGGVF